MDYKIHAQPLKRIIHILKRLYAFEKLKASKIAEEYHKDYKTITRDMEKISSIIPLIRRNGIWWLDTTKVLDNKFPSLMLQSFASNAGLKIDCINNNLESIPLIYFAIEYDKIPKEIAEQIILSINKGCQCNFDYTNNNLIKSTKQVSPLNLYTSKGKWYLIAKETNKQQIKTYDFKKIKNFSILPTISSMITENDLNQVNSRSSIWSNEKGTSFEVKLYVSAYAKRYLEEVPIHKTQSIEALHTDGSVIFTYTLTHEMELLPEIKNWIPHIHILEPASFRRRLKKDIEKYFKDMDDMDI